MSQTLTVSIDDWLYDLIEQQKGEKSRSEFVSEKLIKGFGFNDK